MIFQGFYHEVNKAKYPKAHLEYEQMYLFYGAIIKDQAELQLSYQNDDVRNVSMAKEQYNWGEVYMCSQYVYLSVWPYDESNASHLVQRGSRATEDTRSICRRLLERKISSLTLWEEVPRKAEAVHGDRRSARLCTIELKCVRMHVCVWGRGSSNYITCIQKHNSSTYNFMETILCQWYAECH